MLKNKMAKAKETGTTISLKETIKDLETVTKSYEDMASHRKEIAERFTGKIAVIDGMQKNVDNEIETLNNRIKDYTKELNTLQENTKDPETLRTRKKAILKAIEYVNDQKQLWLQFNGLEQDISGEMTDAKQRIDNFVAMIDSSAILFREGLNLLKLQQNINDALSLFTVDLPTMQKLTQDMESSWDDLDYLVNSLTSLTVKIKEK
jgi:chromosome segregation ATPase